jgi:hypothetical protein
MMLTPYLQGPLFSLSSFRIFPAKVYILGLFVQSALPLSRRSLQLTQPATTFCVSQEENTVVELL